MQLGYKPEKASYSQIKALNLYYLGPWNTKYKQRNGMLLQGV